MSGGRSEQRPFQSGDEWVIAERRSIDGVVYIGMACNGCGKVFGVAAAVLEMTSPERKFVFYCSDCHPSMGEGEAPR